MNSIGELAVVLAYVDCYNPSVGPGSIWNDVSYIQFGADGYSVYSMGVTYNKIRKASVRLVCEF